GRANSRQKFGFGGIASPVRRRKIAEVTQRQKPVAAASMMFGPGGILMQKYQQLIARLATISRVRSAGAVLGWDHQCYMPPGGAAERGETLATLGRLSHEMFTADET